MMDEKNSGCQFPFVYQGVYGQHFEECSINYIMNDLTIHFHSLFYNHRNNNANDVNNNY